MSLHDVLDKVLDSRDATVGGGAASAIAGAMAAGLAGMVARLSPGRNCGLTDERYLSLAEELDFLAGELSLGAQEDERAFLGIKGAFALPKDTEEARVARRGAVEAAAIIAAEVPLENGRRALRILEICAELEGRSNPAAGSDIAAGRMLARMAAADCALNVEANLPLIKDVPSRDRLRKAAAELKETAASRGSLAPEA
jgi:formiminotetrahydrofolate cyclodeaminase